MAIGGIIAATRPKGGKIRVQTVLTLQPDATAGVDAMINSDSATTNYGTLTSLDLGYFAETNQSRPLLKFDLSSVPTSAIVQTAVLTLKRAGNDGTHAYTFGAYKVLRNWVESQATWNIYSTGNSWGTAGCNNTTTDRSGTAENAHTINFAGNNTWDIPLMVQDWVTTPASNFGLILLTVEAWTAQGVWYPYSSDDGTAGNRPQLVVTYLS